VVFYETRVAGRRPEAKAAAKAIEAMKRKIDSPLGRIIYGRRIATVEPVFANLRHNKRLDRFTLRSRPKVNAQWQLYCMVHNIEKIANYGFA
jgi:phospholipid N-methyltransferase